LQTGLNELEQPTLFSSISASSEIPLDDPRTELAQHKNFLGIITKEPLKQEDGAGHAGGITVVQPAQGENK
jgi:hypothetical protein